MSRTHQPDQDIFRSVLPDDVQWERFPAFPPSVRLAVVVGEPSEAAPYVIRVKVPNGVKLMPHAPRGPGVHGHFWRLLHRGWRSLRRGQARSVSARERHRSTRRHSSLPLGKVRRVCQPGDGYRATWSRVLGPSRRSTKKEGSPLRSWRLGGCGPAPPASRSLISNHCCEPPSKGRQR
jgi:hypothetical protein